MNTSASEDDKIAREKLFHNERFADDPRRRSRGVALSKPATLHALRETYRQIQQHAAGKSVLDYGCARGETSRIVAGYGAAHIEAIDISEVAIAQAQEQAVAAGIKNVNYQTMNAEQLTFADNSFDLVCGFGILHHLDLDRAYAEIARVLKPSGRAIFLEPLGHNPVINFYRRLTPKLRTDDEHPLKMSDLLRAKQSFGTVRKTFVNCLTVASLPLGGLLGSQAAFHLLANVDRMLFTCCPPMGRFAWNVVIELSDAQ